MTDGKHNRGKNSRLGIPAFLGAPLRNVVQGRLRRAGRLRLQSSASQAARNARQTPMGEPVDEGADGH